MAIHEMTTEDKAHYSMPYYMGHERGLCRHAKGCPHFDRLQVCVSDDSFRQEVRVAGLYPDCKHEGSYSERCSGPFEALYMQISYTGCVLELGEHNGYDDSDFYALAWDDEQSKVVKVQYATTRGWTYPNHAEVDATPEVVAKAEAYYRKLAEQSRLASLERPSVSFLEGYRDSTTGEPALLELKDDCKSRAKCSEKCRKCAGTGAWTNPKNSRDKRPCFGCGGTGTRTAPAPAGSPMVTHAKGKRGRLVRVFQDKSRYGSWVRSERVELVTDSNETFVVSLDKVRVVEVES